MAEIIDVQARKDLYEEVIRAKNEQTNLAYEIELLKAKLEGLKTYVESIDLSKDETPTWNSEKLISSGAVYEAVQTLNRKIDSLKPQQN